MKEIDLKNYRPFTREEAEHFIGSLVKKCVNVHKDGESITEVFTFNIHGISDEFIAFGNKHCVSLEHAVSELKFYDGSPFGVKKEEKLLTTEDGVDVYDPETVLWWTPSKNNTSNTYLDSYTGLNCNLMSADNNEFLCFSTEQACKDFIESEKNIVRRHKIFNFFSDNYELILLDSEIDDIINELTDK